MGGLDVRTVNGPCICYRSTVLRDNFDAEFWAQCDLWLQCDCLILNQMQAPALRQGHQDQNGFHPREGFSDALATAAAKREVGEFRSLSFCFGRKAFGTENEWIGEVFGIALHEILAEEDEAAGWDAIWANVDI